MRRDITHFYRAPFQNVYQAYLDAAWQSFGKNCRQSAYTIQFAMNMSFKYNMNGGSCTIHLMPYQDGTAVCIRYTIVQLAGARYKAYDEELAKYVCQNLGGAQLMDVDIPMESFLSFAQSNGDFGVNAQGGQIIDDAALEQQVAQDEQQYQAYEQQGYSNPGVNLEKPQQQTQYAQPQQGYPQQQYQQGYPQQSYPQQSYPQPRMAGQDNGLLKRKKIGLIVWGAILLFFSIVFFSAAAGSRDSSAATAVVIGLMMLAGGTVMLVFGIRNAVNVTRHNNSVIRSGTQYIARCPYCGLEIRTGIEGFAPHHRFPEGFIYCPGCKKPVSKNAFMTQNF